MLYIVVFAIYSNRRSCNSHLTNVHDTASFALGLMKDSVRESLSPNLIASLRENVRKLASVLKDANLSASCIDKKYQRHPQYVKVCGMSNVSLNR